MIRETSQTPLVEIEARQLSPELPAELRALQIFVREPQGRTIRLYAVGDVGFCGELAHPGTEAWAEVGPLLRSGDLTFANLETPMVPSKDPPASPFVAPGEAAPRLRRGGFQVLSLANNHIADAGSAGVLSTLEAVRSLDIAAVGAGADGEDPGRLVVTERSGLRVGWLACARTHQTQEPGASFWELEGDALLAAARRHRDEVDVLVVSIHWGYMYVDYPDPSHRTLALELLAAGVDLVLGHHAHVLQGVETGPGGGVVCHNLGNFLLDWRAGEASTGPQEEQRRGAVMVIDLDRAGVQRLAALPIRVDDDWIVRWATGENGRATIDRLRRISHDLGGDFEAEFFRQRAERNTGLTLGMIGRRLRRGDLRPVLALLPRLRPRHGVMLFRWVVKKIVP
ncbi:MAG: CapA family protein [Thermoanaerobaculia bacterium]|nr:CapA family protein [Thermoanaerobaculia bacterium]